jgi:hypothetical protein
MPELDVKERPQKTKPAAKIDLSPSASLWLAGLACLGFLAVMVLVGLSYPRNTNQPADETAIQAWWREELRLLDTHR